MTRFSTDTSHSVLLVQIEQGEGRKPNRVVYLTSPKLAGLLRGLSGLSIFVKLIEELLALHVDQDPALILSGVGVLGVDAYGLVVGLYGLLVAP